MHMRARDFDNADRFRVYFPVFYLEQPKQTAKIISAPSFA